MSLMRIIWRSLSLFVLCLALSLLPQQATAQGSLQMQAQAAYQGLFKFGEWLPVFVTLENSGADLNGEVQVRITQGGGSVTFSTPVELAGGARKRVALYTLPNSFSRQLEVLFVQQNETITAQSIEIRAIPNDRYVLGLLTPEVGNLTSLSTIDLPGRRQSIQLLNLHQLDALPERVEGLRILDALLINDRDTTTLNEAQQAALHDWVSGGGRLLLGGGPGAARTLSGLPPDLQPGQTGRNLELNPVQALGEFAGQEVLAEGPFAAAELIPAAESRVLLAQDEMPLVVERRLGRGYVTLLALDVTQPPFDSWVGSADFFAALLTPGAAWPEYAPPDIAPALMNEGQLAYALSNLPALDLPSVNVLTVLLIIYIILVGPINYLVLRRQDRLALAWITVPILTLIFSGLTYGLSLGLRGSDILVNQIAVIETNDQGEGVQSRSYVGVFSPRRASYSVQLENDALVRPLDQSYYDRWNPNVSVSSMTLQQGNSTEVRQLQVNQWSMQSFVVETGPQDWPGLQTEITLGSDGLRGHITNTGNQTWHDVVLMLRTRFQKLGDIGPGQQVEVDLNLTSTSGQFRGQGSYILFEEHFSGPQPPDRDITFKQSVLDASIFNNAAAQVTPQGPVLFGWLNSNPDIQINHRPVQTRQTALVYTYVPIHFNGNEVSVPPGFSRGRLLSAEGQSGTCGYGPTAPGYHIYDGRLIAEVSLPEEVYDVKPQQLQLYISTDGQWPQLPDLELYDPETQEWEAMDSIQLGLNALSDPDRFYNPKAASLRLRLTQDGPAMGGGCLYFDLALEGSRS